MKFIFLLIISIFNLINCFGQVSSTSAIKRAIAIVSERVEQLEKEGFKVWKTDISSNSTAFKLGTRFGGSEVVYIQAFSITDRNPKLNNNSFIKVYVQLNQEEKQSTKDSLLNITNLAKTYIGKNGETINAWETVFKNPNEWDRRIHSYSVYLLKESSTINVVQAPSSEDRSKWVEDVDAIIVYTRK